MIQPPGCQCHWHPMPSLTWKIVPEVPVYPERLQSKPPRKWGRNEIFDPASEGLVHTKTPEAIFPSLSSRSPSNKQTFRSLANLIVTQRAPKTARDQPFLHTHSVKTMSTWQRSCICNIHFILANGTYLATMGIGHWKILLHQDLSTICVPRRPKQCQLLSRQIQLEKNFETPGLLKTPWCHWISSLHSQSQSFGRDSYRSSE